MSLPAMMRSTPAAPQRLLAITSGLERGVTGLRIGFIRHFHEVDMPADREVAGALEEVARTL